MQSPFDTTFIEAQRVKLEKEYSRLEGELLRRGTTPFAKGGAKDFTPKYQDYGTDEESNVAEYAQHETDLSVGKEFEEEFERVRRALLRIEKGTYGIDVATGKPIEQKRLEAYPAAETNI